MAEADGQTAVAAEKQRPKGSIVSDGRMSKLDLVARLLGV